MLHDLQQTFRAAVLGSADGSLADFVQTPRGSRGARIDVYRNTVQASLADTLAKAFPAVERIVGPEFFAALARRFIAAHPPRAAQLSVYGHDFAAFIARDASHGLPYLADVARLEWSRGESYFAADAPLLKAEMLVQIGADIANARIAVHPATRLVSSAFPIMTIWRLNQPEVTDVPAVDMASREAALTTRPDAHVTTRALSAGDAVLVDNLMSGWIFGDAVAAALEREPAFDLQKALELHFRGGTFTAVTAARP